MTKSYGANDIQVLEGLDAVRLRPGMYIGTTGARGLHHLLWEIVDNAVDEAANGFATTVEVILHDDCSVTVRDDGRGIPIGMHDTLKIPGVQVVFTQLHAGGKFNTNNYNYSGGLHGVGASVVNALSRWLEVEVAIDGQLYRQKYESYEENGKMQVGKPVTHLEHVGETEKKGTKIRFLPDDRVFPDIHMNADVIAKRLKELAFLNKGIQLILIDERKAKGKKDVFHYSGGLKDFVEYLNEDKSVIHPEVIYFEGEKEGIHAQVAIQYTDSYTESIFSYVNNIPTSEGGAHETGFKTAVTKMLNDFVRTQNLYKGKNGALNKLETNMTNTKENLDFMKTLNELFTYVQLPLHMKGKTVHSDLYVYTKKKDLRKNKNAVSALLRLDMDYLGSMDIHVNLHYNQLQTKFYLETEDSIQLVREHIGELEETLLTKGFLVHSEIMKKEKEMDIVEDFIEKETQNSGLKRYSFDIRA